MEAGREGVGVFVGGVYKHFNHIIIAWIIVSSLSTWNAIKVPMQYWPENNVRICLNTWLNLLLSDYLPFSGNVYSMRSRHGHCVATYRRILTSTRSGTLSLLATLSTSCSSWSCSTPFVLGHRYDIYRSVYQSSSSILCILMWIIEIFLSGSDAQMHNYRLLSLRYHKSVA